MFGSLFGVKMMCALFYKINFKLPQENIRAQELYVAHYPTQILYEWSLPNQTKYPFKVKTVLSQIKINQTISQPIYGKFR